MNFCPGQNFQSIQASNFKLQNTDRSHCGEVQYTRTITLLLPFVNFNFGFFSGHDFQSIEASNLKLQTKINHITKCATYKNDMIFPAV